MRMATYASRPAWELRARAVSSARVAVPLGLGLLVAGSVLLRTRQLDVGFWIDEGLSVGIADRPLGDIPGVLRQDGSPPLYYVLLQPLDAGLRALRGERPRALGRVRGDHGAGRLLGGLVAVRPPHGVDRRAARGGQPVPDRLRAGGADVRPRRAARDGRARAAGCRRSRRTATGSGARRRSGSRSPSRRCSTRTTGRTSSARRPGSRGCGCCGARSLPSGGGCSAPGSSPTAARSCSTCRGCPPRSTRRPTPARRGRSRRRSRRSPRSRRGSSATSPRSPSCSPPGPASSRCCGPVPGRSTARPSRCW